MLLNRPLNVHGNLFFSTRFLINMLNKNGIRICDIITTQQIPIIDINAIDFNAGCFAKINTPKPVSVVIADKKMDVLYDDKIFFPVLYSCNKPSIIYKL